jgi:uncharacterized membrane protein YbaN (DUF454 family)
MNLKKGLYIALGCFGVGMGFVGAILPLLPAFPFLMLAAFSFGRSSERLNNWFLNTKLYKDNLEGFVSGHGMTWKTKIRVMVVVTLTMSVGFYMMRHMPIGQMILAAVWVFHIFYFCFGVKTMTAQAHAELQVQRAKCRCAASENSAQAAA